MKLNLIKWRRSGAWMAAAMVFSFASAFSAEVVNVYSARHYGVDEDINKAFTEKTGIEVKVVNASVDQLIERLKSEGKNSPADVLVTVDVGRQQIAKSEGLLQPFESEILKSASDASLRDAEGFWYPYAARPRIIVVSKERVKEGEIKTYEDLSDPKWKGRLLIRSSSSSYNLSLLASQIVAHGEEKAKSWAKGVVENMARPPQGGDRDQIKGVASGLADVAVTNSYYLGMLLNSTNEEDRAAAAKVSVIFPNQGDRGAFTNVAAVSITANAKNLENARRYAEFLVSPEVQKMIANGSLEHAINLGKPLSPTHEAWGEFKVDTVTFPKIGSAQDKAIKIFDEVGWK